MDEVNVIFDQIPIKQDLIILSIPLLRPLFGLKKEININPAD